VDRVLSAYQVEELIGRGGMGEVYLARDPRLDRPVALKVLGADLAGDERFRERLLRESRLAAGLDHPNVVPIYEAGEAEGRLFIAMRYVDGTDLRALLRRHGALPPERALALAGQVAGALDAAHARGLVHRDVKPSNVLVDDPGGRDHCYLADFGLTQSASDRGPADGSLMGTLDYVAPEQIRGDPIDGRADQYAFACLLFECLTGSLPFRRDSEVATIFAHLEEPPPAASDHRPASRARRSAGAWDGQGPRRSVRELRGACGRRERSGRTRRRAGPPEAPVAAGGRAGDSLGRSAHDRAADRR
jgi:serine/threonine protein kinase